MADTLKILSQLSPSATTLTDFYTVPSGTSVTTSSLIICNTTVTDGIFRISIAQAGAANNIKQYIYYDLEILAKDTFTATIGLTLGSLDVVRVYSTIANIAFSLFGVEIS